MLQLLEARAKKVLKKVKMVNHFLGYEKTRLFAFEIYWPLGIYNGLTKFLELHNLTKFRRVWPNHGINAKGILSKSNFKYKDQDVQKFAVWADT